MFRIVYVTTGLAYGGGEIQVKLLAEGFRRRGSDVMVVSMLEPQAFVEELVDKGIKVLSLNMRRGVPSLSSLFQLRRVLNEFNPSVVHSQMFHANIFSRVALMNGRAYPLICTAQNTYEAPTKAKQLREVSVREWFYRLTDPFCDLTTQVCDDGLRRYVRTKAVPSEKIIKVFNAIDPALFERNAKVDRAVVPGIGSDEFVWLAVGRLEPQKDYSIMIQAFSSLIRARPKSVLLIAGEGTERERLEKEIEKLDLSSKVHLLGRRADVRELMNMADAFVMSSFYEGLPLVLLEAQSCALPVVSTLAGGVADIIVERKTGFLSPVKDPDALAAGMLRLQSLPKCEIQRMGRDGRENVIRNFSLDVIIDQWQNVYQEAMRKRT